MRSLRRQKRVESLDMLVDTMCDAFGTIILMAVLVSLLAQQTKKQAPPSPAVNEAIEIIQRRIHQAEVDLKDMIGANISLKQQIESAGDQDLVALIQNRERLRDELADLNRTLSSPKLPTPGGQSADPAERQKQIEAAILQAAVKKTTMENAIAAQEEKNRDLATSIAQLRTQLATAKTEEVRQLRLPKERETDKSPLFVLLFEGRAFPLKLGPNQQNPAVGVREVGESSHLTPRSGQGMDPSRLGSVVRGWSSRDFYIVFAVFEDSFSTFQTARQSVVAAGHDYGWKPFQANEKVVLGSGSKTGTQ